MIAGLNDRSDRWPWYAVRVRSNFERAVFDALTGKGLDSFLPTYRVRTRRLGRREELDRPLFSGYLFSRFNPAVQLPVLTTPGVVGIVSAGRHLLPVPEPEIEAVRTVLLSRLIASPWPYLRVGQLVEVIAGPVSGVTGMLVSIKNSYRLVVSISLLQRSLAVEIDADWIRPVSKACA